MSILNTSPYFPTNENNENNNEEGDNAKLLVSNQIYYPVTEHGRINSINFKTNKPITNFQFKVYDLCSQIPKGYVSTYKLIANSISSSPRAVGGALKNNPFAPLPIPCHRVIASNFFIGGFNGECLKSQKSKTTS
ncbi:1992_t:CDS:2 [Entrophospora sp. SA101]|nr:1992_t:CDS:2 [Entrophospora sp. SA101]